MRGNPLEGSINHIPLNKPKPLNKSDNNKIQTWTNPLKIIKRSHPPKPLKKGNIVDSSVESSRQKEEAFIHGEEIAELTRLEKTKINTKKIEIYQEQNGSKTDRSESRNRKYNFRTRWMRTMYGQHSIPDKYSTINSTATTNSKGRSPNFRILNGKSYQNASDTKLALTEVSLKFVDEGKQMDELLAFCYLPPLDTILMVCYLLIGVNVILVTENLHLIISVNNLMKALDLPERPPIIEIIDGEKCKTKIWNSSEREFVGVNTSSKIFWKSNMILKLRGAYFLLDDKRIYNNIENQIPVIYPDQFIKLILDKWPKELRDRDLMEIITERNTKTYPVDPSKEIQPKDLINYFPMMKAILEACSGCFKNLISDKNFPLQQTLVPFPEDHPRYENRDAFVKLFLRKN